MHNKKPFQDNRNLIVSEIHYMKLHRHYFEKLFLDFQYPRVMLNVQYCTVQAVKNLPIHQQICKELYCWVPHFEVKLVQKIDEEFNVFPSFGEDFCELFPQG